MTPEVQAACVGKSPVDSWQTMADLLGLADRVTGQQLFDESEAVLFARFPDVPALPGALRLLRHLEGAGTLLGLATSSGRRGALQKMSGKGLAPLFRHVVCGDDVAHAKPAPDVYLRCAELLGVAPADCLVLEDAPSGVRAAAAAGMRCVVVPSVRRRESYPETDPGASAGPVQTLTSLLDFRPEEYGLPPFTDTVCGTVPIRPPWPLRGPVVKGFGRGSKVLGIPTANLAPAALQGSPVGDAVCGIYYGLAAVGPDPRPRVMAMSIGWNPVFGNDQKTAEPWILHDYGRDFYGEELRLLVCGYIRPEADFPSLDALVERIREDGRVAERAMAELRDVYDDPFLRPSGAGAGLET